ncbi:MAG: type 4a pilus biogenesis protein PilO [Myxococcales bacterium]|nr:MAG: type 4a pilus biogenesis protein PilO [Myxococcales bacterium]
MAIDAKSFAKLPFAGKVGVLGIIIALLSLAFYFSLYMSVSSDIGDAEQKYQSLQKDLRVAEEQRKEYIALREKVTEREAVDRRNLRILPEKSEIPAFLQDLNRVAELSGLKILLVEPRPEEDSEHYIRVPIGIQLQGRYHQLAKFFYHIGRLERAINMENISLKEPSAKNDEMILRADALATTFRRLPPPEAAAPAEAAAAQGGK